MSKIKIKNFGPIKKGYQDNDGWLDIKKVTVFIGNQGSGKSTVAKLISTFTWIEKALVRGDYDKKWFESSDRFKNQFLGYHRIGHYLKTNSVIEYQGEVYAITYKNGSLIVEEASNTYPLPQIMYVPAERNFISYVKSSKELRLSSESLMEFLTEFDNAKKEMQGLLKLPINNTDVEYINSNDTLNLRGEDYKINIAEASSGFQSFIPLFLVSNYLSKSVKKQSERNEDPTSSEERARFKKEVSNIMNNNSLTDMQKRDAISVLASKFNKTAFVNIVEEPEQNLFPSSQWQMLQSLLEFNNMNDGNKLIITTHSPYIINYLTLPIKADELKKKVNSEKLKVKLQEVISLNATVNPNDLVIYELDEIGGIIKKLENYKGLPSDVNYLNDGLGKCNDLYVELLKIEDECL
ncbi:MAG: ATP-binding protein [Candidatus Symbiothrix sp.]|jgi:predicted ATPase|nr:ATP-binding protein [Candidatus Symbiothrix sp.]